MGRLIYLRFDLLIVLLAFAVVINSQFQAFVSPYVINPDAFQHTYWMQQFWDSELFRDHLLTDFARSMQPWGVIVLYWMLSHFADPLLIGKIVPVILFPLSSLYFFKLVQHFTNSYTALLASLLFVLSPAFLIHMVGGHARAFALSLLIILLYYLVKKQYGRSSFLLILQSLFHPIVFLVGALTYLFTFIQFRHKGVFLERNFSKVRCFCVALIVGAMILMGNYVFTSNPFTGSLVIDFDVHSRNHTNALNPPLEIAVLPLAKSILSLGLEPFTSVIAKYPESLKQMKPRFLNTHTHIVLLIGAIGVMLFLWVDILKGKVSIPIEFFYVFLAGIILYELAYAVRPRLYASERYLLVIPLLSIIILSLALQQFLARMNSNKLTVPLIFSIVIFVALHFNLSKGIGLKDYSEQYYYENTVLVKSMSLNKDLYAYLRQLPKNAVIAAHPFLADPIQTFGARKVLVSAELSRPWPKQYWQAVRMRTLDFFEAYYSQDLLGVYQFCKKHNVDYLVIDQRHFQEPYLSEEKMYLRAFNGHIQRLVSQNKNYALAKIPEKDKLFTDGNIFLLTPSALINQ